MLRLTRGSILKKNKSCNVLSGFNTHNNNYASGSGVPSQADVVVIGGGVAGCTALYHLTKKGVRAVLVERAKLTSGTTWHTGGLCWRLRPNDTDIRLLNSTRSLLTSLEQETGLEPGWTQNGGMFIAHTDERVSEYKRLHTIGHYFNIETRMISPSEAAQIAPVLDPKQFKAALYSPGSGAVDPTLYCAALVKGAQARGGQVIEDCPVTNIITTESSFSEIPKVQAVETKHGTIKTSSVVLAGGVWSRNLCMLTGADLPITAMKHAYVVTEAIEGAKGGPNIRDHDFGIYIGTKGESLVLGGYETNPELIKDLIDENFQFGLYELNHNCFKTLWKNGMQLVPALEKAGIKSDICGPESFTPDHKPLVGEDPRVHGLYHLSGFNSMGMQLSAGCAEQLALWITQGRPELAMFAYDIRRFTPMLRGDRAWAIETSHEAYATNYDIIYPHDQPLAGRNHRIDVFHEALVASGAVMEQAHGWERPGYFIKDDRTAPIRNYDWFGNYDHVRNADRRYEMELEGDRTFKFSKHHDTIGEEALATRNNVGLFNLSSYTKMYLTGPDSQEAANWLFTADVDRGQGKTIYACSLNARGGTEADVTVTPLEEGVGTLVGPIMKGQGYYIVAEGTTSNQVVPHLRKEIAKKKFRAHISVVSDKLGILSLQGPKSGELLQSITETPITDENFPRGMSHLIKINNHICRAMRVSVVGELGYQIHIPTAYCLAVYNKIIEAGRGFDLRLAGFRALYSLNAEKGYHLWNHDLRIDDNPVEANLSQICRKDGPYLGKQHVDNLKKNGVKKRRVFFTVEDEVALFGLETIWRDDSIVGYLRRGNYGYSLDCSIGIGYVEHPNGKLVNDEFLKSGNYQIEAFDRKYKAAIFLRSPFDPKNQRIMGQYDQGFQEQTHFED